MRAGIAFKRCPRSLSGFETGLHEQPLLAFANDTRDFLLKTDASKEGLGAVLSQKQADGCYHPVTYGSWVLTTHEKNYHSTKLEFLALTWAVMEHFKVYCILVVPTLLNQN